MERLLIIGCGDIARRALPQLQRRYRVAALVRSPEPALADSGVELIEGDLDDAGSLATLAGRAERIAHLAPPANSGPIDLRTRNLLAALTPRGRGAMLPRRFVYLSNRRMKAELGVRLRYSRVQDGVPGIKETA